MTAVPISRRGFLAASTLGALAVATGSAGAIARGGARALRQTIVDPFASRRARLGALMKQGGVTGLFIPPSPNFFYLTGTNFGRSERILALLLQADGAAALVAPAFEAIGFSGIRGVDEILAWEETEDPYAKVAAFFGRVSNPRIGVEPTTYHSSCLELRRVLGDRALVDAAPLLDQLRMVKEPHELELLRAAITPTMAAFESVYRAVKVGHKEKEIAELAARAYRDQGFGSGSWHLCQVDATAAMPHASGAERVLREGSVLLIDTGTKAEGYASDITRTVQVGTLSSEFKEVHEIVREAQREAQKRAGPGVPCAEVDRAARDVITKAGHGAAFLHRLGHGIGLEGHEHPYLVGNNQRSLAVGMTFTIEPGIYLKDRFGVRIEDMYVVTEDGAEALSPLCQGPRVICPSAS